VLNLPLAVALVPVVVLVPIFTFTAARAWAFVEHLRP
jgi:hypothetical protein